MSHRTDLSAVWVFWRASFVHLTVCGGESFLSLQVCTTLQGCTASLHRPEVVKQERCFLWPPDPLAQDMKEGWSKRAPVSWRQPQPLGQGQCGPDPTAHKASSDQGVMQHMGQQHGGQQLLPESVGQLRRLDRAVCVVCGTIRSQRCNRCGLCQSNTALRELRVSDTFQDRRQPLHHSAAPGGAPAD